MTTLPLFLVLCISAVRGSEAEELPLKYENFASRNYASKYNAAFRKAQDLIDDNTELEPVIQGQIFLNRKTKAFLIGK